MLLYFLTEALALFGMRETRNGIGDGENKLANLILVDSHARINQRKSKYNSAVANFVSLMQAI
jgi:hypothetical protein